MSRDSLEIECRGYNLRHWLTEAMVLPSVQGRAAWALTQICLAYHQLRGPLLTSFGLAMLNSLLFSYLPAFINLDQEFLLQYYFVPTDMWTYMQPTPVIWRLSFIASNRVYLRRLSSFSKTRMEWLSLLLLLPRKSSCYQVVTCAPATPFLRLSNRKWVPHPLSGCQWPSDILTDIHFFKKSGCGVHFFNPICNGVSRVCHVTSRL